MMEWEALVERARGGDLIAYFGYGSLVNPATHRTNVLHYERAQLRGFKRSWQERPDIGTEPIALLSSAPSSHDDLLDGLLVFDLSENLPLLDEREYGYDRLSVTPEDLKLYDDKTLPEIPLYVYSGRLPQKVDAPHYILQSYLDAVLQGYLHQYGEEGVRNFVERTARFNTKLFADRASPRYPRYVSLSESEQHLFDQVTSFMSTV
ncbi:gamma-glutamylcyclotransferase family protein [Ahrensia kielensis]|uniref:Gamma-glutamylcyclotransferase family protein n=1 Tax=Ahrensia kielensis TaxID=76980 RepID=A0ABU9T559_9HYPH